MDIPQFVYVFICWWTFGLFPVFVCAYVFISLGWTPKSGMVGSSSRSEFCLQSFPSSGSFQVSQLFASGGQNIWASALVFSVNAQGWFPLGLTGWISLQSKGLSRVFSSTTVQNHQFFGPHPSLWSNSLIRTWQYPWRGYKWDSSVFFLSLAYFT